MSRAEKNEIKAYTPEELLDLYGELRVILEDSYKLEDAQKFDAVREEIIGRMNGTR